MPRPRASVVFRGPAFGPGAARPDRDLQRFGDQLSTWLRETLRQLGADTPVEPGMDGPRWSVDFDVEGARHRFLVEHRDADPGAWVGRVIRARSFPASLLGRRATPAAVGLVRRALAAAPEISAISWRDPA